MEMTQIFPAWSGILRGRKPFLSLEVTRECPLRCPGCYAYGPEHVSGAGTLRNVPELTGDDLVEGVLALRRRLRPMHISLVGGEPLLRYREIDRLLPLLAGVEVQLVTSAVRPIPAGWANHSHLHMVVSIDGLPEEHNRRRAPATYERVLENIAGHRVIIHCTITRQMLQRPNYLREFAGFWSKRAEARKIWLHHRRINFRKNGSRKLSGDLLSASWKLWPSRSRRSTSRQWSSVDSPVHRKIRRTASSRKSPPASRRT